MDLKTILEITSLPFIISTVAADGLAPVGARAFADTVMTSSSLYIYQTSTRRVN